MHSIIVREINVFIMIG